MKHFIVTCAFSVSSVLCHGIFTFYHNRTNSVCKALAIIECFHGDVVGKLGRIHVKNLSKLLLHIARRTHSHHAMSSLHIS